ncbi:MAG TPA: hypothetical protein VJ932_08950, partial [Alkalispirochaeta sp.]|nr:hypothetical protein [Alkalispirochaeta sp.]
MKRLVVLSVMVLAAGSIAAQQTDQRTGEGIDRIAVVPFVNTTDFEQWDNLAEDMTHTIRLTLALGERFDVANPDMSGINPYAPEGPLQLRRIAEERRIEGAVIGRISALENGRVELEASVWSNTTGQIVGSQRREAFGSFDILDAADELVAVATSALLGYRVDFGAVVLQPSRSDVQYSVALDGNAVGESVRSIPQVLVGQRRIDISVTVAGREQLVYSAERRIRPGEAIEVSFGLPRVTRQEQREVLARHELARNLLGQPDNFRVAFEALSESRSLLAAARGSDTTEVLQDRQRTLERAWQLDEEFFRLTVSAVREADGTESVLPGTYRLLEGAESADAAISTRVRRNGAAYYHVLRLLWSEDLGAARWNAAQLRLEEMESVVTDFELDWLRDEVTSDRRAFMNALNEAERVRLRRRRPWPYIGIAVGIGGLGYGGYLIATETDVFPGERDTVMGQEFARSDVVQWGSIGVGGAVAAISTAVLVRNLRAGENFLRDWARSEYGFEIDRTGEIVSAIEDSENGAGATVIVLGPADRLVTRNGQPHALPMLVQ